MNECSQMARVSAYHDGELPADATREVEAHLGACPACAAELEQFRSMSRRMASAELPRMPGSVRRRVRRAIDDERAAGRMRIVRAVTGIAASLFLFAGARVLHERSAGGGLAGQGLPEVQATSWVEPWEAQAVSRGTPARAASPQGASGSRSSFAEFVVRDLEKGNE